jgi:5-methylcytosine-specific restriction endonuclease McrA
LDKAMLMAEVGDMPVRPSSDELVATAFNQRRTYSRVRGSYGRINQPLSIRAQVFERDGETCRYCGAALTWQTYECDHVHPVSKGGSSDLKNLAAACEPCNRSKGAKPLKEWSGQR